MLAEPVLTGCEGGGDGQGVAWHQGRQGEVLLMWGIVQREYREVRAGPAGLWESLGLGCWLWSVPVRTRKLAEGKVSSAWPAVDALWMG